MSKKPLNVAAITNELEGASLFFEKPGASPTEGSITVDQSPTKQSITEDTEKAEVMAGAINPSLPSQYPKLSNEIATERSNDRTVEVTIDQTIEVPNDRKTDRSSGSPNGSFNYEPVKRPKKRSAERHTFEIYSDQLLALKEIALRRERITGEKVLMGDLSKEAFDLLINREKLK